MIGYLFHVLKLSIDAETVLPAAIMNGGQCSELTVKANGRMMDGHQDGRTGDRKKFS